MKQPRIARTARAGACLLALGLFPALATAVDHVVVSQVYGGGGNTGATYKQDFIELFNASSTPKSLNGWSIQYASAAGGTWNNMTLLPNVTLQPGQYYLVQQASGSGGTMDLPSPDLVGTIALSGTAGKVALVSNAVPLAGTCPSDAAIVDFVGFGATANCSEGGSPTPAPSNTTAVIREGGGCVDTDHNATDFVTGAPTPRNTSMPLNMCSGGPGPITLSVADVGVTAPATGTTTATFTVSLSSAAASNVTFNIATLDGTAVAGSDYVAANQNGATITAGNTTFTFSVTILANSTPGTPRTFKVKVDNIAGGGVTTTSAEATGTITSTTGPLRIGDIQGDGAHPARLNQTVTFDGVVTAIGAGGYFVQDAGDGNPLTSDAIFVYGNAPAGLVVGSAVKVTGKVVEFYGLAEITQPVTIVTGTGTLPAPVVLDATTPSADPAHPRCEGGSFVAADSIQVRNWRCLQSMRVTIADGAIGAPNFRSSSQPLSEAYGYVGSHPRPMRGPGLPFGTTAPSPPAGYNPPTWDAVPYVFGVDTGHLMTAQALNGGMRFHATGVMGFDFGIGVLWPTEFTITDQGPAYPVAVPVVPAGTLTIGSQNVLRLFNDKHDSGDIDACADTSPGSSDVCPTPEQFQVRLQKLSRQVRDVLRAPAVLGVQEVENLATLQSLADRINADQPGLGYTAHLEEGNDVGGIDVGFLVRGDVTVHAVTQLRKTETTMTGCSSSNPPPCLLNDRPPLLLDASFNGGRFAVLVLHNRSLGNVETQAYVRNKRFEQALSVARIAQAWQTGDSASVPGATAGVPLAIVGDFNAFEFTDGYVDVTGIIKGTAVQSENLLWDPSLPIVTPALYDTGDAMEPAQRYSFMFNGYAQELDHGVVTADLQSRLLWAAPVHGNADIPAGGSDATDPSTARRSADHDGFVMAFSTTADDVIFKDGFESR